MARKPDPAKFGRRIIRATRSRRFTKLGWTIVVGPIDVFEYQGAFRMYFGTMYGFEAEEVIPLRARRLRIGKHPERTWWVLAVRNEHMDRQWAKPETWPITRLGTGT